MIGAAVKTYVAPGYEIEGVIVSFIVDSENAYAEVYVIRYQAGDGLEYVARQRGQFERKAQRTKTP